MMWSIILSNNMMNIVDIESAEFIRYSENKQKVLISHSEDDLYLLNSIIVEGPFDELEKLHIMSTHEWLIIV